MGKAIVIGAGVSGLATAIRLRRMGLEVDLFEANDYVGGKLTEYNLNGFRFDAGPSLFTLPELLDQLFMDNGEDPADYYQYDQLDIITRYFYPNGKVIDAWSEVDKFAQELFDKTGEPRKNVLAHLEKAKVQYESTKDIFLFNSMQKMETYLKNASLKVLTGLTQIDAFRSMAKANQKRFKTEEASKFFNRYATYNGSDPYQAPATLNLIAHLEHNVGAYFMKGGMHRITQSLEALAVKKGVKIHLSSPVDQIRIENDRAIGVEVQNSFTEADLVVSNLDVHLTYHHLMPNQDKPEKILDQPKSSSAMIFYWGMNEQIPELELHNLFFADNYKAEFEAIRAGRLAQDPTVYVYISSKQNTDDAPKGKENWFVMINVPNDSGQNWESLRAESRKRILAKLEKHLGRNLEELIVAEDYLDPKRIESRTSSFKGALYGNSSNNMLAAFLRHPNFSRRIPNLYFGGGSVHPGGGIPLCLASAQIIEKLVAEEL